MRPPSPDDVRKAFAVLSLAPQDIKHARDVNKRANRLLQKAHPDVGGTKEEAQAINAARDFLLAWLKTGRGNPVHRTPDPEGAERARRAEAARQAAADRAQQRAEEARAREEAERQQREDERQAAERQRRTAIIKRSAAACALLLAIFIGYGFVPKDAGPPLTAAKHYSFAEFAPALPALKSASSHDEFLLSEHRKWASGRTILECQYGEDAANVVRFWLQDERAPYGVAWNRVIEGHPFAGIHMGAPACPSHGNAAQTLPDGLALQIETWQAPETVMRKGEYVAVERPPALNCLYFREGSLDWLVFSNRARHTVCPRAYDGPPVTGVAVYGG